MFSSVKKQDEKHVQEMKRRNARIRFEQDTERVNQSIANSTDEELRQMMQWFIDAEQIPDPDDEV